MYTVGDSVLYGRMGVCQVESISVPPFQKDRNRNYYKLRAEFSSCDEVIYIPVDADSLIRSLIGSEEAEDYLDLLSRMTPQACHTRQSTELSSFYQKMLDSCGLQDSLLLLKTIFVKGKDLESRGKKLGQVDVRYQKLAERLVCEEFAAVLHTTPELMRKRVYDAMDNTPAQ